MDRFRLEGLHRLVANRSPSISWTILLVVVASAVFVATGLYRREDAEHRSQFLTVATERIRLLESSIDKRLRPVQHVAAVLDFESGAVTEPEFSRLARNIRLAQQPGLVALQWIPREPVPGRDRFPVRYSYSVGPGGVDEPGADLAADPVQRRFLEQAGQQRHLFTSPWYRQGQQVLFRVLRPIFRSEGEQEPLGFSAGVYSVTRLLSDVLCSGTGIAENIDLVVADTGSWVKVSFYCSGGEIRMVNGVAPPPGGRRLVQNIGLYGGNWTITAVARRGTFTPSLLVPLIVILGGLLLGTMLMAHHRLLIGRERQIRELVTLRTAELENKTDELKRRTEQLEVMNAELEEFAFIASHDLKAPLRAVSQLASWIDEDAAEHLDPETRERLRLMRERVIRMDSLIDGLLAYSRAGKHTEKSAEPVPLERVVREVVNELNLPAGFRVEVGPLPSLEAQAPHLRQIFQNLIANAAFHHDRPETGTCWVGSQQEENYWRIELADDGPGIPQQERERVFRMFTSLDTRPEQQHTGIGLAVVRKLVRSYGGQIDVTDNFPRGSVFRIWWPK